MGTLDRQADGSIVLLASPALRATIERVAVPVTLPPGAMLFSQGDEGDSLYILDEGEIEISVLSANGRKLGLDILTKGEVFGEIGLFAGERTASATAIGPVKLRQVRRSDLMAAIRNDPGLALDFIELLCARLRIVSGKLEDRWFLPLPNRLARRLLHLLEKVGSEDGVIAVSQSDIADFAGATREGVARTLAVWRTRGWISASRGALKILDREALERLAEEDED